MNDRRMRSSSPKPTRWAIFFELAASLVLPAEQMPSFLDQSGDVSLATPVRTRRSRQIVAFRDSGISTINRADVLCVRAL